MSGIMQLWCVPHDPYYANVISIQYFNSLVDQEGTTWTLNGSGASVTGGQLVSTYNTAGWVTDTFTQITGDFTFEFDFTCGTNNTGQWNSYPSYRQNVVCMGSSEQYYGVAINKDGSIQFRADGTYVTTTSSVISFPSGVCRFAIESSGNNKYLYLNGTLIASLSVPYSIQPTTIQVGISMTGQSAFCMTDSTFDNVRLTRAARYSGSSYSLPPIPYPTS